MTRSKIQMTKFFIFLLIFLLGQSAVCNESFRKNRTVPASTSVDKSVDEVTARKHSAHVLSNGQKSQRQDALLSDNATTIPDGNKTLDNITSKPIDVNKTAQTIETRREVSVRVSSMKNYHLSIVECCFYFLLHSFQFSSISNENGFDFIYIEVIRNIQNALLLKSLII